MSSRQRPIRVAVVGCGEIAQIMHLPYLAELPEFEISGICDISPSVLEHVGDRYGVRDRSDDHRDVVDGADVVAVLTHDLAVLRGLLGRPQGVLHSAPLGSDGLISVLDYGRGRTGVFELALLEAHRWWDQSLAVYTDERVVTVEFPNPYVRNAATTVEIQANAAASAAHTTVPVSHDTSFRREWQHLAACIREDTAPLTDGEGARADVELSLAMVHATQPRPD